MFALVRDGGRKLIIVLASAHNEGRVKMGSKVFDRRLDVFFSSSSSMSRGDGQDAENRKQGSGIEKKGLRSRLGVGVFLEIMDTYHGIHGWLDIHRIPGVDAHMKFLQLPQLQNRIGVVHSETPLTLIACRATELDE